MTTQVKLAPGWLLRDVRLAASRLETSERPLSHEVRNNDGARLVASKPYRTLAPSAEPSDKEYEKSEQRRF